MASRRISDLAPDIRHMADELVQRCKDNGIDLLITCTYRSDDEQDALYAQGRTAPGKIVTNAKGGQSKHNTRNALGLPAALAFDVVPMVNGKCVWDSKNPIWQVVGELGENIGLEWAGRWRKFKEFPHFQRRGA